VFPVENNVTFIRLDREYLLTVVRDITDRKELEDQVRQAQKMEAVGQLAGGVAHDFNNLLTIINGYSDIIQTQLPADNPMRELVREIGRAGERAASLTRQLLAFSRKQVLEPKVLSLNAAVTDMAQMLQRLLGEDIDLNSILEPGLGRIKADPGQIEQLLMNLAVNARDAMPQGGKLIIETSSAELDESCTQTRPELRPGPYVLLSVSDTGTGMDEATKAHIFEPFFTTKGAGKGTGLGLATVHGIVKQSNGHITVTSALRQGTSFKVYLPVVEEVMASAKSHSGLKPTLNGKETILLAEDEPALRALARHILQMHGYTVLEAGQSDKALRIAEEHRGRIHLLVTDVVMPVMSGRQLAERLVAVRPGLRVLYLSGYTDDAVVRHGVLQAETAFLQKPFTPSSLAAKVREVLDQAEE
jgi:nitrogen-specific signal transduction histidine kinase/ActR/RegA family two-component response regulator